MCQVWWISPNPAEISTNMVDLDWFTIKKIGCCKIINFHDQVRWLRYWRRKSTNQPTVVGFWGWRAIRIWTGVVSHWWVDLSRGLNIPSCKVGKPLAMQNYHKKLNKKKKTWWFFVEIWCFPFCNYFFLYKTRIIKSDSCHT